jgi:hypothetical protein
MQEAESTTRLLRELCIRNSIPLPPDLDGNGQGGRSDRLFDDLQSGPPISLLGGSRADGAGDATPPAPPPATAEVATQAAPPLTLDAPVAVPPSGQEDAVTHVSMLLPRSKAHSSDTAYKLSTAQP